MRVALYARVSTSDQRCAIQLETLQHYADVRDYDVYEAYTDSISGAAQFRPGRDKLLADAAAGRFDAVLVTKLDRWGRSVIDVMESLRVLSAMDPPVRWIAIDQGLDTDQNNPVGRLLLQLLAAVAEFERALIKERTKAAMNHAREHGTKSGKPIGGREAVYDREAAYQDRLAGRPWAWLSEKYGAAQSTLRDGLALYAAKTGLPPLPNGLEHTPQGYKVPGSGKQAKGDWVCEFCHRVHSSRAKLRACCALDRAAKRAKLQSPSGMKELRRRRELKRQAGMAASG
jgi:putative DNA-invertase from lambdoid prophage Rac